MPSLRNGSGLLMLHWQTGMPIVSTDEAKTRTTKPQRAQRPFVMAVGDGGITPYPLGSDSATRGGEADTGPDLLGKRMADANEPRAHLLDCRHQPLFACCILTRYRHDATII